MTRRLAVLPVLVALAVPALGGSSGYRGRFAGSPAFQRLREDVARHRVHAPSEIARSLALDLREDPRLDWIRIEFVEPRQALALGFPPTSRGGFRATTDRSEPTRTIVVIVDHFVHDRSELPGFVTHEMIHAVMDVLMEDRFLDLPAWLQEGLAIYGAGQGPEKLDRLIRDWAPRPDGFGDGLGRHRDELPDYVEGYLAIEYLARFRGPDAVRELVSLLVDGSDVADAIAATSGFDLPVFEELAHDFARLRVRNHRLRRR